MQLGLTHGALQAKQQSIVEHGGVVDAVGIADERIGEAAEIEQAIPVGIVTSEAGDLETEHDPDMSKRDFRCEPREAAALDDAGAGKPEVFVDDDDLLRRPAERGRPGGQGILALCGLAIVLDLSRSGLSEIDIGSATQMRGAYLCEVIHRSPPFVRPSRSLAR